MMINDMHDVSDVTRHHVALQTLFFIMADDDDDHYNDVDNGDDRYLDHDNDHNPDDNPG